MEKLQNHELFVPLFSLLFLLQLSSHELLSSAYTLPEKYFINCGSETNVEYAYRNFVGDMNSSSSSSSFSLSAKQSSPVKANNSDTLSLYQTARIFKHPSLYEFDINENGTYVVRLHFFAVSSSTDLSSALFNVSASGFLLLHNLPFQNKSNAPVIKEFLLSINISRFVIYFTPQESSFAFVNAIELFLAPENFIPDEAPHISSKGSNNSYKGLLSQVLQKIHRINIGGPALTPENDTLGRNWIPDDAYLYNQSTAKIIQRTEMPNYIGANDLYIAPSFVYQTAKEINVKSISSNITWCFNVIKKARHLVRFHFWDITSTSISLCILQFNLYISSHFNQKIDPCEEANYTAAPFYIDFVVDSDYSGLMNISIGPRNDSVTINAFLNGLEIMEIMQESGSVPMENEKNREKHVFLLVGLVLGGLGSICILIVLVWLGLKCRKQKRVEIFDWFPLPINGGASSHRTINSSTVPNLNLGLKISFSEIQLATKNFNMELLIGDGGFGKVYEGTLKNGKKVAVKRSELSSGQGFSEFQMEIMVLSKIRHLHLVSLIGYCDERSEMILVYEFMEKGTLKSHLYDSDSPCLSWKQRLEICIGAARGLHYLHTGAAGGIIHRDIKSANILLDENYVAKVADFGISKLGPADQTHVTTVVKGSFGYLDPEYIRCQMLSDKSDVYSFGVVLLEVLCARPAINIFLPREQVNLAQWGMLCIKKGLLEQIVDPLLVGQINPNSLRKFGETVQKCLQEYGDDRPTMTDVLWDLEYALQLQKTAIPREPHEDSNTDAPSKFLLQHFPSRSMTFEGDDLVEKRDDDSGTTSEVFSQLRIDGGR